MMITDTGQLELKQGWKGATKLSAADREEAIQLAVDGTGFGRFNAKVMAVSSLIYMNVSVSIMSMGFILPASSCDFEMRTVDKGHLSASVIFGMLCGSYLWGCLADIKGRKLSLLIALFLHGITEFVASLMPFFWGFLFLKFVSGFAMNAELTVIFSYLGEFQPTNYRDRLLSWMEISWVSGMIVTAVVGWMIIPLTIDYTCSTFFFHSWNLFAMILSLPALIIGIILLFLPETPKYLAETRRYIKVLDVLSDMYTQNTGNSCEEYITTLKKSGNESLIDMIVRAEQKQEQLDDSDGLSFAAMLRSIYSQTVTVVRRPYLRQTVLMCSATTLIMSSYYTFTLWMPELFRRFAAFNEEYPNRSGSVCDVMLINDNANATEVDPFGCLDTIHTDVYLHTLILGAACIPTGILMPLLVDRLGYKIILVLTTTLPGLVTVGFFLVKSSIENLILSCIFEAFTSVSTSFVLCMLVDMYPTNLRATATGLAGVFSRAGAIAGNLLIGALIDNYCVTLILIVAAELFVSGVLIVFVPANNQAKSKEDNEDVKECTHM